MMNNKQTDDLDLSHLQAMSRSINNPVNNKAVPNRIFLHLDGIGYAPDGNEYAFGTNIATNEKIKVRLNTVDERVQDMIQTGRLKSENQARQIVQNQYELSSNPRKTLSDRSKNNSVALSFDQSFEIPSTDNYRSFRAHWFESISTKPSSELIIAPAHVQFVSTPNTSFGRVEIIENHFTIDRNSDTDKIKQMFMSALNHEDEYSAERSGNLNYILRSQNDGQAIYNGILSTYLQQIQAGTRNIKVPANINTTLTNLMSNPLITANNTPQNNVLFNHDLNRILVNKLLNQNFIHKLETSDPQLQNYLRSISTKIEKGEIYLDAYTSRNIFLGKETVNSYRNKASRSQSPLKIYNISEMDAATNQPIQHKGYLDTMIGIERHSDTLSPYVTFTATTDPMALANKLEKLDLDDGKLSKKLILNEDFTKHALPQYVKTGQDHSRHLIEESKRNQQSSNSQSIDFGFNR
ncbi:MULTISPECIES: hypothetical protein [Acinetobacter]|uniref:hypothetical protein n=2 Tax=Acinetobacter TaxID=469 RepID=UPI001EFF16AB|nr:MULTISPECIES: hypothetical protein [Acinetobacter]